MSLSTKEARFAARNVFVPSGAVVQMYEDADAAICVFKDGKGRPCALGFSGTSARPAFNHYFSNEVVREEKLNNWLKARRERIAVKQAHKLEMKAIQKDMAQKFGVGVVFYTSWGWEQTNVDFYEVVRLVSPTRIEVRELACDDVATGDMTGR